MRMVVRAGLVDHKVGFHKLDLELEKIHSVHHFQTIDVNDIPKCLQRIETMRGMELLQREHDSFSVP
jgi:hypothetical protein